MWILALPKLKRLQATNVLHIEHTPAGKLYITAHNTDVWGFYHSLLPLLGEERPHAWVFGTGGAASAVLYALEQLGISYEQVSRTPQSGQRSYESLTREEGEATLYGLMPRP